LSSCLFYGRLWIFDTIGISAFVSKNIDDIFLLIVFFINPIKYSKYQVLIGQYIGIGLLY